ncbi:transposase, partial [Propionibacterium freudenreichii]
MNQLLTRDVVISALARDLQVGWRTLWKAIEGPLQERLKEISDQASVEALGLDEHVWRHCGPHKNRMITGVVDHTRPKRGKDGKTKPFARLLDVQVGRSGAVAEDWLASQGKEFASKIRIAAIDPYRGYANAISATLKEADMVVDIFHVTKLASQALDEVRRRVQQDTLGRRGHA